MSQLRLPGTNSLDEIHLNTDRKAPVFWVRRLRVLRELSSGDEHIIRDIELRRGLNIIWAPPAAVTGENAPFKSGVAGHTAGKTTFCRFVRYVLGERGFGPEATRARVRNQLSSAWVVAEVVVDTTVWIVARPLGIGPRSFCIRDGTIDQLGNGGVRLDYQEFLSAIGSITTRTLAASRFPATNEIVRWEHLMPWLCRDQECRFADFLEWRHSSSDSDSPFLAVEERQFVVRSILGLISEDERTELQKNARLLEDKKDATDKQPLYAHQAGTDHARVCSALDMKLPAPSDPLFGNQARTELDRRRGELKKREESLSQDDRRKELRQTLERAVGVEAIARKDVDELDDQVNLRRDAAAQLAGNAQRAVFAALPPAEGYCGVPMILARQEHCPLAFSFEMDSISERSERTAAEELEIQRQVLEVMEARLAENKRILSEAAATTTQARRAYLFAAAAFDDQREKLLEEKARLFQIGRLVDEAETAWQKSTEQTQLIARLEADIKESYGRQEQLRSERQETLRRFSGRFDYVVRAFLGEDVSASINGMGRSLSLSVDAKGERESVAITTVKLLAFDLAAMISSTEGYGNFPRFLVHDGPREADMAPDIYERLFLFARELERCFSGEPSFQYIVTTTTPPPAAVRQQPWLRLELAGVPTGERLLRCDL
jgi:hypothetical protein